MGSAAAFHLASRGQRVLGLDRFTPPHTLGSSHGQTRIIREAYFEDPIYVPMVQRAYGLWSELERAAATRLFLQTGGLMLGGPDSAVFSGARRSAEQHGLPHEILSAAEVRQRFPAITPEPGMLAVLEPRAGILFPEDCVAAHLRLAEERGATLQVEEPVLEWKAGAGGVEVRTARGTYHAGQLILSAGAWAPDLLPGLNAPLAVERQTLFWFTPARNTEQFAHGRCPIHLWQFDERRFFYGFPDLGDGVKLACHHDGAPGGPDDVVREVSAVEVEHMRGLLRRFVPDADGAFQSATVCLYTNTPDENFWIDRHPAHEQVWIASPCSGHGFKFSSVVGEILADLCEHGRSAFDLARFRTRW